MTVSTTSNKIIYSGNGATTSFPFAFSSPAVASDIVVTFTDANGVITTLTNGPGATQYQLAFNPATGTNPTPVGGTVTYNPSGTPIATGTSLTIMRTLPLTQNTSFANQGTLWQPVIEAAFDYLAMVEQQQAEVQGRQLTVPVSDPPIANLPAVAARANLVLGFDSNGNPIGVTTAPAGTISSAMAPVVAAASLAAGRTALGLGAAATEGIGSGLQDDGASNVRTFYGEVTDSIAQTVTVAFHAHVRYASAAITYTFPLSSTLFNGFGFWIHAGVAAVTLAINGADTFVGASTGASLVVPPGGRIFISTDAAGTWYVHGLRHLGFSTVENVSIVASVAASALTIALKDANGNDPSASSPILFDVASATGGSTQRAVTGPLSITVPSGASLGTVNAQAARIWVCLFDNAGTPILGVYNSLSAPAGVFASLLPWDETTAQTSTAISAGSTSAQVYYTSAGVTSKNFKVIGYVEATEATAGTWATAPSKVQLFGPGVKKPGDTVQEVSVVQPTFDAFSTVTFTAGANNRIVFNTIGGPNVVAIKADGNANYISGTSPQWEFRFSRGTTNNTNLIGNTAFIITATGQTQVPFSLSSYDIPNGTSSTYAVQGQTSSGQVNYVNAQLSGREIFV